VCLDSDDGISRHGTSLLRGVANPDWATKIRAGGGHDLKDYHISLKATLR
jgi:hypothetical protein